LTQNLNISVLQWDLSWENPIENHEFVDTLFSQKTDLSSDLVVLPEMFSSGFTRDFTEKPPYESLEWMKGLAQKQSCSIFGSLAVAESNKAYNRGFWVNPDGSSEFYNKKHLFKYGNEHHTFSAGDAILQTQLKGWMVRPLICYDLRFPVWARNTKPYYDILIYVASWPEVRRQAWLALLKARAIENQCYVIGVNRIGKDGYDISYSGDTCVFDFKGETLLDAGNAEGRFDITLSYSELQEFRQKMPFLEDADEWKWS
jgi:omega-amidase